MIGHHEPGRIAKCRTPKRCWVSCVTGELRAGKLARVVRKGGTGKGPAHSGHLASVSPPEFVGDLIRREDQVMARKSPYPAELRRRAVAMVAEVRSEYDTEFAAITAVAHKLGIGSAETLRKWVRQAEVDAGTRSGVSSADTTRRSRSRGGRFEKWSSGCSTIWPTVLRGLSDVYGFWKTY